MPLGSRRGQVMKYVLRYDSPENIDEDKLRAHFPAHRARWATFQEQGSLLLIGPLADRHGALAVFTSHEAAEQFATSDPFVLHGLVARWTITAWHEALLDPL